MPSPRWHGAFSTYDADGSGKLDRAEFHKCLIEAKLGLTDHQVQHLMHISDEDDDGHIDYNEFLTVFIDGIMELARMQKIDQLLQQQQIEGIKAALRYLLDELMIPLHIAFDIAGGGQDACDKAAVIELLHVKGPEWAFPQDAAEVLMAAIAAHPETSISWVALVELVEKLLSEEPAAEETGDAAASAA